MSVGKYSNTPTNRVSGSPLITEYVGGLAQVSASGVTRAYDVISSLPCREVYIQASSTTVHDLITVSLTSAVSSSKGLVVPSATGSAVVSAAGRQSPTLQLPIDNVGRLWFYTVAVETINVLYRN